jgi:two-component system NtrC family response regulator
MIAQGSFREDLYYRLAEIVVRIPTLAERHGDAPCSQSISSIASPRR